MDKTLVLGVTNERRTFDVNQLLVLIGQERFDGEAPLSAYGAEIVSRPGEVVDIVWRCRAPAEILQRLAPDLAFSERDDRPPVSAKV